MKIETEQALIESAKQSLAPVTIDGVTYRLRVWGADYADGWDADGIARWDDGAIVDQATYDIAYGSYGEGVTPAQRPVWLHLRYDLIAEWEGGHVVLDSRTHRAAIGAEECDYDDPQPGYYLDAPEIDGAEWRDRDPRLDDGVEVCKKTGWARVWHRATDDHPAHWELRKS